jgi:hypothetical protein
MDNSNCSLLTLDRLHVLLEVEEVVAVAVVDPRRRSEIHLCSLAEYALPLE